MAQRKQIRWHIAVFLAPAVLVYTAIMIVPLFGTLNLSLFNTDRGQPGLCRSCGTLPRCLAIRAGAMRSGTRLATMPGSLSIHMLVQNPIGASLLAALILSPRSAGGRVLSDGDLHPDDPVIRDRGLCLEADPVADLGHRAGMLDAVGLKALFAPWLGKEEYALTTLALISVWQFVGIPMMLIYAALAVDPRRGDRGRRDGRVTGWAQFWKIKLPLILPSIGIISILTFVGNFNAFDLIYVTQGALAGRISPPIFWARSSTAPSLASSCRSATRIWGRPLHGDVRDHPAGRLFLSVRHPDAAAPLSVLRG
jgi:raffinose/stachyose/melibiose transport system permease protein